MHDLVAAAVVGLLGVSAVCFRLADWSSKESNYWAQVDLRVRLAPRLDAYYRPVLEHARAHRPSALRRIAGWADPEERMR